MVERVMFVYIFTNKWNIASLCKVWETPNKACWLFIASFCFIRICIILYRNSWNTSSCLYMHNEHITSYFHISCNIQLYKRTLLFKETFHLRSSMQVISLNIKLTLACAQLWRASAMLIIGLGFNTSTFCRILYANVWTDYAFRNESGIWNIMKLGFLIYSGFPFVVVGLFLLNYHLLSSRPCHPETWQA